MILHASNIFHILWGENSLLQQRVAFTAGGVIAGHREPACVIVRHHKFARASAAATPAVAEGDAPRMSCKWRSARREKRASWATSITFYGIGGA